MCLNVVHCRKSAFNLYIGRPSKWGNPFSHKVGTLAKYKTNSKEESLTSYENWIRFGDGSYLLNDLHELKDLILGCWCKPSKCHGDILKKLYYEKYPKITNFQIF
jgi:hypothetical protein